MLSSGIPAERRPAQAAESDAEIDRSEIAGWDPAFTKRVAGILRPIYTRYFRSEVRGLHNIPPGKALVVSNHSGGLFALDIQILAIHFYQQFGYGRPIYTLCHDLIFTRLTSWFLARTGFVRATRDNAAQALREGAVVVTFPGGDYDAYRPTLRQNVIDFGGRTGYVRAAIEAGAPIVPTVTIGLQESQLFLSRGTWLAERRGLKRRFRTEVLPITFGFPFGFTSAVPPNLPLPSKFVAVVLEPIDIAAEFGDDPDVAEVDARVRSVMQTALDRLASQRRWPILG
jgi:1-acyl-sn-glycerol-3-phosphate acyltransferase